MNYLTFADRLIAEYYASFDPMTIIVNANTIARYIQKSQNVINEKTGCFDGEQLYSGLQCDPMFNYSFIEFRLGNGELIGCYTTPGVVPKSAPEFPGYSFTTTFIMQHNNDVVSHRSSVTFTFHENGEYCTTSDLQMEEAKLCALGKRKNDPHNVGFMPEIDLFGIDIIEEVCGKEKDIVEVDGKKVLTLYYPDRVQIPSHSKSYVELFEKCRTIFLLTNYFMRQPGQIIEVEHPRKVAKKIEKRTGKAPSNYYRVLPTVTDIGPGAKQYKYSYKSNGNGTHNSPREHLVRPHFRHVENHPLPQFNGTFYIPAHKRGSGGENGKSKQIYRVVL